MFSVTGSLFLFLLHVALGQSRGTQFHVIREWRYLNFTWPNEEAYTTAIMRQTYVPDNNVIAGLKFYDGYYYLTLPRMKNGVPATLTRISATDNGDTAPALMPYPSWEMNTVDDCNALQNVQNIEIDSKGQIWIVDGGHTSTLFPNPVEKCSPKLVIHDIRSNRTVATYTFPDNVVSKESSFLYDLVVDNSDGGYAYISDNSGKDPGIVVYSQRDNRSWKIRNARSMRADPSAVEFRISGTTVSAPINVAAIALGPKIHNANSQVVIAEDREVYYCPLSSRHLYSINTTTLKNEANSNNGQEYMGQVRDLGLKASQTVGMIMDNNGVLYYGLLSDTSIARWDTHTPFESGQKVISRDPEYLQWASSFAFDQSGNLLLVTNKLQKFIYDKLMLDQPNFRILSGQVGAKSYLYDSSYDYNRLDTPITGSGFSSPQTPFSPDYHQPRPSSSLPPPFSSSPFPPSSNYPNNYNTVPYSSASSTSALGFLCVVLTAILLAWY